MTTSKAPSYGLVRREAPRRSASVSAVERRRRFRDQVDDARERGRPRRNARRTARRSAAISASAWRTGASERGGGHEREEERDVRRDAAPSPRSPRDAAAARAAAGARTRTHHAARPGPAVVMGRQGTLPAMPPNAPRLASPRDRPPDRQGPPRRAHRALDRGLPSASGATRSALELETVMDIPHDRVRIAFLGVGESKVELVEPTDDTTGVARFLASKGEGFHHVCFEVAEPRRDAAPPRDRRHRADRHGPAQGRRGPGRVPPSAVVPRRPRRAHRGARRAGLGVARATEASGGLRRHAARTSAAARPPCRAAGRNGRSGVVSTRKSTFQSRNGCSTSDSIRRPASMSAVTISPRPWSQPCSRLRRRRRRRVGVRALDRRTSAARRAPSTGRRGAARRARRPRSRRPGRPGGPR